VSSPSLLTQRPFQVHVPDAVLADLRERVERTRWSDRVAGSGWAYGTDQDYLRELCHYWREEYDWRAAEARINSYDQILETVDGVEVQCIRVPGVGPAPFPLLLLHGWPGSVWEFMGVLGALSDPGGHGGDPADAFDLIVPSLPGFGFSGAGYPVRSPDLRKIQVIPGTDW
jgi:microsomal epoxide hydrolase